ncbi:hypothetical protein [Mycobacteroides abscessus]|uniref:hypothetical protein n=1 Tax=Mycobacteroides abscessus TaxID=36809 RepID=UPI000928ACD0|nr:hypothetical protein [Mycobacteroides abscessus]SIC19568.1 Uncharacterised protein [Mycobacteroides abscessus subsp. abscessus]
MTALKTLVLEYTELRRATVQVPATYDPDAHAEELTLLVGQIDSEDISTDDVTSLTWTQVDAQPDAPVLVESDPDRFLYTAQLVDAADAFGEPIQEWPTPQRASKLRATVSEYVGGAGSYALTDDANARIYDRYPVVSTDGSGQVTAYLLLSRAADDTAQAPV